MQTGRCFLASGARSSENQSSKSIPTRRPLRRRSKATAIAGSEWAIYRSASWRDAARKRALRAYPSWHRLSRRASRCKIEPILLLTRALTRSLALALLSTAGLKRKRERSLHLQIARFETTVEPGSKDSDVVARICKRHSFFYSSWIVGAGDRPSS